MKKIGIIGSGVVARTLAEGCKKHGYEVMLGSRDVSKLNELKSEYRIGTMSEASSFGDILILAVKGIAAESALAIMGAENCKGKTIIDTTNPIDETKYPFKDGVIQYFTEANGSLMGSLQAHFTEAHFVKAFNSVGNAFMVNPNFDGIKPSMFICGDDEASKKEVKQLLDVFGWETEDMGTSQAAGAIESLCILWCIPGFRNNQWSHAFKLLKK